MVIDFFKGFEFSGVQIGQGGLSSQELGHGFGKVVERPGATLNHFAVVDRAGLLGKYFFVFTEQQLGIAMPGFGPG